MAKTTTTAPPTSPLAALARMSFTVPVVTLGLWAALAFLSQWVATQVPTVPTLDYPSTGLIAGFATGAVALAVLALWAKARGERARARVEETDKLGRALLDHVKVEAPHARFVGKHYRGLLPRTLLITASVPAGDHPAVAARFASITGSDPALVKVEATRKGTVVYEDQPDTDEVAEVHDAHDQDEAAAPPIGEVMDVDAAAAAVTAAAVNADVQNRAHEIISGVLGPRGARGMKIETLAIHPNGTPSKMRVRYPAAQSSVMDELAPKIAFTLNQSMLPVNGLWRHEWLPQHDMVILTDVVDPLNRIIKAREPDPDVDLKAGIQVGVTEDGTPWLLPLFMSHTYIGGISGSGKSSLMWAVFEELRAAIGAGRVRMVGLDPKLVELSPLNRAGALHRFESDPAKIVQALDDILAEVYRRKHVLAERDMFEIDEPDEEFPFVLIVIDEVTSLVKNPECGKRAVEQMAEIIREGRALGFGLLTATQDLRVDAMPIRDMFITSVCLRVRKPNQVDMVLGQGVRNEGAYADKIPASMIGVAYAASTETGQVQRVRSTFIPKEDRPGIAAKIGKARARFEDGPPEHTPAPAGRPVQAALEEAVEDEPQVAPVVNLPRRADRPTSPPRTAVEPAPAVDDEWVDLDELAGMVEDDVVYVRFGPGEDVAKVVAVEDSPDVDGELRVTYLHAGDHTSRETDLPSDDAVVLASKADFEG